MIFWQPYNFLNNCEIVHYRTIDYIQESRLNNVTEQSICDNFTVTVVQ